MVNFRLKRRVELHYYLNRFRKGRGTGTAEIEAKLEQQLEGISHDPLFQVFLDVRKMYN